MKYKVISKFFDNGSWEYDGPIEANEQDKSYCKQFDNYDEYCEIFDSLGEAKEFCADFEFC